MVKKVQNFQACLIFVVKSRSISSEWRIWHRVYGAQYRFTSILAYKNLTIYSGGVRSESDLLITPRYNLQQ
jgi:hypothetical protein